MDFFWDHTIDCFHCDAIKKINRIPFSGLSQEIVILLDVNKRDTSPSFTSVRFPKPYDIRRNVSQKFRELSMEMPCWCGAHLMCTNIAAEI